MIAKQRETGSLKVDFASSAESRRFDRVFTASGTDRFCRISLKLHYLPSGTHKSGKNFATLVQEDSQSFVRPLK
jgi:hypothetical protein